MNFRRYLRNRGTLARAGDLSPTAKACVTDPPRRTLPYRLGLLAQSAAIPLTPAAAGTPSMTPRLVSDPSALIPNAPIVPPAELSV